MYEIVLAPSVRLPEEVVIFRSDSDQLLFDLANVRVNSYDPDDNPDIAKSQVTNALMESIRELDLKSNLAIKSAAQTLGFKGWEILTIAAINNGIQHFETKTMGQALGNTANNATIVRLLDVGAFETTYVDVTPEIVNHTVNSGEHLLKYKVTPFGNAMLEYSAIMMFASSPEARELAQICSITRMHNNLQWVRGYGSGL